MLKLYSIVVSLLKWGIKGGYWNDKDYVNKITIK
jgi:hypothetical protein